MASITHPMRHALSMGLERWGGLVVLALLLGCNGKADDTESSIVLGGEHRTLIDVNLDPAWAAPGTTTIVTARVPRIANVEIDEIARITLFGETESVELIEDENGWSIHTSLSVPMILGDHDVTIRVSYTDGEAMGHGLLAVSEQEACDVGEVRQGGQCHPRLETNLMGHNARVIQTNRYGGDRKMAHPRVSYRVGDNLISCITDAMAVTRLEDLEELDAEDIGTGEPPANRAPYTETLFQEISLFHCDYMVFDEIRSFAMVATRGNLGGPGGLSVWYYPDVSSDAPGAPEPIFVEELDHGFERLVWDGTLLYGTQHPDSLVVMDVDDEGVITEIGRLRLEETLSLWALAKDGDIVYATDAGDHQGTLEVTPPHGGETHTGLPTAGRVHAIDVSDPTAPHWLGSTTTTGLGKGIAVLPDGLIAIGGGASGVDLVDMRDPNAPEWLHVVDTPGLAHGLHYEDGFLAVADWDSVILFDASEWGVLRLLDADDFVRAQLPPSWGSADAYGGLVGAGSVTLSDDQMIVNEWNSIIVHDLVRGGVSARSMFSQRRIDTAMDRDDIQPFSIRIHNGGRETLWVEGLPTEETSFATNGLVIAPGAYGDLDGENQPGFTVDGYFAARTNDFDTEMRGVYLSRVEGNYRVGDTAPTFRLPAINHCNSVESFESCDLEPQCFDSLDPLAGEKPLLMAFFSTW